MKYVTDRGSLHTHNNTHIGTEIQQNGRRHIFKTHLAHVAPNPTHKGVMGDGFDHLGIGKKRFSFSGTLYFIRYIVDLIQVSKII